MPDDLGVLQSDQFCTCGYNLHGQKVTPDDRLDFPVVRCAECGRWHPAGHGSMATRPWLKRLAGLLLGVWLGGVLLWSALAGLLVFGFGVGLGETYSVYVEVDAATVHPLKFDESANWNERVYTDAVTGEVLGGRENFALDNGLIPHWEAERLGVAPSWHTPPPLGWSLLLLAVPAVVGLLSGVVQAAVAWHARLWQAAVVALLPIVFATTYVALLLTGDRSYFSNVGYWLTWFGVAAAALLGGWLLGLLVGRPIGRGMANILIPPKPRQALSHLWAGRA